MKLLFTVTYYTPYVSGLTLAVSRWAAVLAKRGFDVSVLAMKHEKELGEIGGIGGIRVVRAVPLLKANKGFISADWLVKSWTEVGRAETVIVNLPQPEAAGTAVIAKIVGRKLIAYYHCDVVLPRGAGNRLIQWLLDASHVLTMLLADDIVTYTQDYARHSRVLRVIGNIRGWQKIHAIVPPVPAPRKDPALARKLKKNVGKADVVIGVAARLAAEKGIEYLIESLDQIQSQIPRSKSQVNPKILHPTSRLNVNIKEKEIQTIKLVIAGSMDPVGEQVYKEKIMKLVAQNKDDIVFLGEIPPEKIGSFYALLDVLVLPSVNSTEAFGFVQAEAMMMGVPVVASNLPGVRVPVQATGMGLLAAPGDSGDLARAIGALLAVKKTGFRLSARELRVTLGISDSPGKFIRLIRS